MKNSIFFFFVYGDHIKRRNNFWGPRPEKLRAQNRVLRCAQPGLPRLLRKTTVLTKMLRQRNSATAHSIPGSYDMVAIRSVSTLSFCLSLRIGYLCRPTHDTRSGNYSRSCVFLHTVVVAIVLTAVAYCCTAVLVPVVVWFV